MLVQNIDIFYILVYIYIYICTFCFWALEKEFTVIRAQSRETSMYLLSKFCLYMKIGV